MTYKILSRNFLNSLNFSLLSKADAENFCLNPKSPAPLIANTDNLYSVILDGAEVTVYYNGGYNTEFCDNFNKLPEYTLNEILFEKIETSLEDAAILIKKIEAEVLNEADIADIFHDINEVITKIQNYNKF